MWRTAGFKTRILESEELLEVVATFGTEIRGTADAER
jgi:hypothetical protein